MKYLTLAFALYCASFTSAEPFRSAYHFTPEKNWINDPNGLVYYEDEYHLFYQYNPHGDKWGHMSWGHAVSKDLMKWERLPLALAEENGIMIFSGSAVIDWKNSSGFGVGDEPPMVAVYTGHRERHQDQRLAFSNDKGRTWTKYKGNPVLDLNLADFRDPKVMWHEETERWVMTVSLSKDDKVSFFSSPDLKSWTHLSDFGPAGSTGGLWECPDLFKLPVEGAEGLEKWVLLLNISPGAPAGGSGCQYFIGDFDGKTFSLDPGQSPEKALWLDYGADNYAFVTWSDIPKDDGRRIGIGWMNNWGYAGKIPTAPWRGAMTLPRELSLSKTSEGIRLHQQPVKESKTLRKGEPISFAGGSVDETNSWLADLKDLPDCLELSIKFENLTQESEISFEIHTAENEFTSVGYDKGNVFMDRTKSGETDFAEGFARRHIAPCLPVDGQVSFHLFLDRSSLELFAEDGEIAITNQIFPKYGNRNLAVSGKSTDAIVKSIVVYRQ